jgi:tetratricopeptide (TPR) repeat protein
MYFIALRAAAALLTAGAALSPALANDADTCKKGNGDDTIAACSRLLARNRNDVSAYVQRGNAYYFKGEYDRALAEYDQATRLDSKYVFS